MGDFAIQGRTRDTLIIEKVVAHQAAELVRETIDDPGMSMLVRMPSGRELTLPTELAEFVFDLLGDVGQGHSFTAKMMPSELTTSVAAAELGVSRPTLMKYISRGLIASHKVGSHTRVKREDLLEFKDRREARVSEAADVVFLLDEADED